MGTRILSSAARDVKRGTRAASDWSTVSAMRASVTLAVLLVGACATDLSTRDAKALVAHGALLLDVRTSWEFAEEHLPNAVNIPVEELQKRVAEVPRDREIVVYCHSGARAGVAAILLKKAGHTRVHNLGAMSHYRTEHTDWPLP